MIVRNIIEISVSMTSYDIPKKISPPSPMNIDFELRLCTISNPRPGLTPGTALRAVGSGTIVFGSSLYNYPIQLYQNVAAHVVNCTVIYLCTSNSIFVPYSFAYLRLRRSPRFLWQVSTRLKDDLTEISLH